VTPEGLAKIRKADVNGLPAVQSGARLGACVGGVRNFYAVGLNYVDHAKETGSPIPDHPVVFYKTPSCIVGANDNVMMPKGSEGIDWEVEIAFVMGRKATNVAEKDALRYVAGYCICNDVSEREFQMKRSGSQWSKGKGCDTFGPLGPWLVTADEVKDVQDLDMWLDVNGKRMQTGNTRTMIFSIAKLVSDVSQYMTLMPGDVVTTGTPPGVGLGMKPPQFMHPGDVVSLGIQGLGEQRQKIVAFKGKK
jgi:2-keto-4-pentenoate hydratase/2-oxohepta-3-ene-1,7-dioic acid hydratase in catechol pathway